MRLPRTSIAALMGCVLILALAFAALLRPTPLWAAVCFSGMLLALTYALVVALFARGRRRAFWAGFLIGGGSYLFLQYGPYCHEQIGPITLPTAVLDLLYGALRFPLETPATFPPKIRQTNFSSFSVETPLATNVGPQVERILEARLAAERIPFPAQTEEDVLRLWQGIDATGILPVADTSPAFARIGHSFLSLLVAIIFGLVARRLGEQNTEAADAPAA